MENWDAEGKLSHRSTTVNNNLYEFAPPLPFIGKWVIFVVPGWGSILKPDLSLTHLRRSFGLVRWCASDCLITGFHHMLIL